MTQTQNKNKDTLVEPIRESLSTFKDKIDLAIMQSEEWVETTPEIIKYFNPAGLNGSKFFIYKGIKVCPMGESDKIDDEINQDLNITHAKFTGFVEGRS